jgi:hypothetical protein
MIVTSTPLTPVLASVIGHCVKKRTFLFPVFSQFSMKNSSSPPVLAKNVFTCMVRTNHVPCGWQPQNPLPVRASDSQLLSRHPELLWLNPANLMKPCVFLLASFAVPAMFSTGCASPDVAMKSFLGVPSTELVAQWGPLTSQTTYGNA